MSAGLFSGCESEPDFAIDIVAMSIKAEYKEKFLAEEFTVEDFEWNNVERIEYREWNEKLEPEKCWMVIYLKEHGKQVLDAVKHFKILEFVGIAEVSGKQYLID